MYETNSNIVAHKITTTLFIVDLEKIFFNLYLFNIIIIKITKTTANAEYKAPLEFEKETIINSKITLVYINSLSLYERLFLLLI